MAESKAQLNIRLKSITSRKEMYFQRIQRLYNDSKELDNPVTIRNFAVRLKSLEETKFEFEKAVSSINEIELMLDDEFVPNFQSMEAFDELYCNILVAADDARVKSVLGNNSNVLDTHALASESHVSNPVLPKLSLPSFSGNIQDWPVFYECFKSLIHENRRLTNVDRVNYLLGQLSGKALKICAGLPPIGSNYDIIWQALIERYQNPRALASSYLEQILNVKPIQVASENNLNYILERCDSSYKALQNLGISDLLDFTYAYLIWTKLDTDTRKLFENTRRKLEILTYQEIISFVKEQAHIYTMAPVFNKVGTTNSNKVKSFFVSSNKTTIDKCCICQAQHNVAQCSKLLDRSPSERYRIIKEKDLCILCFGQHRVAACKSRTSCKLCNFKHNTLLHFIQPHSHNIKENRCVSKDYQTSEMKRGYLQEVGGKILEQTQAAGSLEAHPSTSSFCSTVGTVLNKCTVLLSTAIINIFDINGVQFKARFLLDSGSQAHFLTEKCAKVLQLNTAQCESSIKGIGICGTTVKGVVTTTISSRFDSNVSYTINLLLVNEITNRLPDCKIRRDMLDYLSELPLADDRFDEPGEIDGIIGAQLFPLLLGTRKVSGSLHLPIAVETKLGYVVMGSAPTMCGQNIQLQTFHTAVAEPSLNELVGKFWEVEDFPKQIFESPSDVECEKIYASTVHREPSGRYIVTLPFKYNPSQLGDSYSLALRRFQSLENKFDKLPLFKKQYCTVIQSYLEEGYMKLAPNVDLSAPHYFLPHHAVLKDSLSTPLRCVFDGSAKTSTKLSLNDLLHTGPKLQSNIVSIFLNFRLYAIAFTADIRRMYLRIKICDANRKFQQMLWRFEKAEPIEVYYLDTVVFGLKPSPFLALRTIKQLAMDEANKYPLASKVIQEDFYMDDLLSSCDTLEEGKTLYWQLTGIFRCGQFQLTKWAANSEELLREIPAIDRSPEVVVFDHNSLKVLGLQWYPYSDVFTFSVHSEARECTKRNLLSTVARLFDPCGFIAPVTLLIKVLIKKLWVLRVDWDEVPTGDIPGQWFQLQSELKLLVTFKIPRHLGASPDSNIMLVGFCDACLDSYGAVVYMKSVRPNGDMYINIVCAKTKVAPLKVQSIPRLELCAASLLAKLLNYVKCELDSRISVTHLIALSDSTVALHWIASPPYLWPTFVANRVAQIQGLMPRECWFHIKGDQNISDGLSRGMTPSQLINNQEWVSGPNWLKLNSSMWPIQAVTVCNEYPEPKIASLVVIKSQPHPLYDLILRSSSWNRLVWTTVYVLRFLKILRSFGMIHASDSEKAELTLIKIVQYQHYFSEILLLKAGKLCSAQLRPLCPFLHDGLIRVGGRLANSKLGFDQQHPFLLPGKDPFVLLLIDQCHRQNLHTGPSLVLSILRQKFWILGARNVVRYQLRKCNHCFKLNPKGTFPKMADLPAMRVREAKPFLHCGVDYGGPFYVTLGRKRGIKSHKAYLCLFICLTTKAVHLELVSDLSTDLFLAAFKRFLSRRGAVACMYSDCGTNFIGAKNELDNLHILLNSEEYKSALGTELCHRKINWKFQPPLSPHFSGVWEAQIKSVKTHLYKVIGLQILTYEELNTVLTQIEALLNSRPLSYLSTDPADPAPLTPAHFLTLTPLVSLPAHDVPTTPRNLLDRKRLLDHLVQGFWKRWHIEYLTQLQLRQKWNIPGTTIKKGTIVIIKQDNTPPLQWPIGTIDEVFPGSDGIVRVVNVRTKTGIYKRPVVRLCPLPLQ